MILKVRHHLAVSTPDLDRFVDACERWLGFARPAVTSD